MGPGNIPGEQKFRKRKRERGGKLYATARAQCGPRITDRRNNDTAKQQKHTIIRAYKMKICI